MRLLYALERSDLVARAALGSVKDLFVLNLHRATAAIAQQFWRRVPYRYVGYVASLVPSWNSFIAALNPTSAHDDVAQIHAAFLLGEKMHRRHDERLWARKKCLEKSGYHGEPGLIAHIRDCGQTLRDYVAATCPGRPLIFAPLHTVSDRIAAAVCSLGPARHATVVSAYAADALGKDEMHSVALLGTKLDRLMVADLKAAEFRRRIKAVSEGRSHLVVFPDALPEFTSAMAGRPMRTRKIDIFKRPGRLHAGLEVLSKASKAVVVYFALYEARGCLRIDVLGSLNWDGIASSGASMIEEGIRRHWRFWLLWRCRSLFYMNPESP